jgi:hypothetical protein
MSKPLPQAKALGVKFAARERVKVRNPRTKKWEEGYISHIILEWHSWYGEISIRPAPVMYTVVLDRRGKSGAMSVNVVNADIEELKE